jgi:hypothetical protein
MWAAFANQEKRSMLYIGTIAPSHRLQTLLEVLRARCRNIPTAQRKYKPAEHSKVFLLMQREVRKLGLMWFMYHHLDDPAGADADPGK